MIKNRRAFIVGLKSSKLSNKEITFLKKYKPWGVILFSRNISSIEQTKKLTDKMSKYFDYFTSVSEQPLTIDYVTWMKKTECQKILEERLSLTLNGPSSRSTIHGGGSSFKQKSGNYSSYSSRFEQFIDTEPFESLVDHFKNQIINYYNVFGRDYYPNSHPLVR